MLDLKLKQFNSSYVKKEMITNEMGIVLYSDPEYHKVYEFYYDEDEEKLTLDDECIISILQNTFEFTDERFEDIKDQKFFEWSSINDRETFRPFLTYKADWDEFDTYRPHLFYRNNELLKHIWELKYDGGDRVYRCGNCGYPYFKSYNVFEYKGGTEGLDAEAMSGDTSIACSACGRVVKNPALYMGGL